MKRIIQRYLLLAALLPIVLLVGCSNLFGSTFTREEIRATAFVIVANRLTQDSEPQVDPTATLIVPATQLAPIPTNNPDNCLPEEFSVWVEVTTADVEILEAEFEFLQSGEYTSDDILEIQDRALEQESNLLDAEYPRCAARAQDRLREVYSLFSLVLRSVIEEDEIAFQTHIDALLQMLNEYHRVFSNVLETSGNQ